MEWFTHKATNEIKVIILPNKKPHCPPNFCFKIDLNGSYCNIHSFICSNQQLEYIKKKSIVTSCYDLGIKCHYCHCANIKEGQIVELNWASQSKLSLYMNNHQLEEQ